MLILKFIIRVGLICCNVAAFIQRATAPARQYIRRQLQVLEYKHWRALTINENDIIFVYLCVFAFVAGFIYPLT